MADALSDLDQRCGVEEVGRPYLHGPGTGQHELDGILGRRDPSDPDDRDVGKRLRHLVDAPDGHATDRGTAQSPGHAAEPRTDRPPTHAPAPHPPAPPA